MKPETRRTRTTNNPGVVDLPKSRRTSSEVAAEKTKKKNIAAAKAQNQKEEAARVARVEMEVKIAQKEATQPLRKKSRVKRTFARESPPVDVATENAHLETALAVTQHPRPELKRKAAMGQLFEEFERTTFAKKIARTNAYGKGPSSTSAAAPDKPRGLTDVGRHHTPIDMVAEDLIHEDEVSEAELSDDGEDDPKYPGSSTETLVSIKSESAPNDSSQGNKSSRNGVNSLPREIRRTFSQDFIPVVVQEFGCSPTPWENPELDALQACVNDAYPDVGYTISKGDPLHVSANSRVMCFRSWVGSTAVVNVRDFMKKFKTPELVEEYVRFSLVYHREIPFLYNKFEPTSVRSKMERSGYKVIRSGLFQHQAILNTMLLYFGTRGIKAYSPSVSEPGSNPIGALALVCTAVERALRMHSTGHFVEDKRPFSEKFWGHRTAIYAKLTKDLPDSRWNAFYKAMACTEDAHESELSQPIEHWTDNPEEYFLAPSDPASDPLEAE